MLTPYVALALVGSIQRRWKIYYKTKEEKEKTNLCLCIDKKKIKLLLCTKMETFISKKYYQPFFIKCKLKSGR